MRNRTLVIGGNSFLGGAILASSHLFPGAIGTSRRLGAFDFLDLDKPYRFRIPEGDFTSAVICAAITCKADCCSDPMESGRINVFNTFDLVQKLTWRGLFVVVLSSSEVFDGSVEFPETDSTPNPRSAYGSQKLALERLCQTLENVAVLRPTKITESLFIVEQWRRELLVGHTICPLSDYVFSDVPVIQVICTIRRIIDLQRPGIFHCSGRSTKTYADLAFKSARDLQVSRGLVRPQTIAESGIKLEHAPEFATLGLRKTQEALKECDRRVLNSSFSRRPTASPLCEKGLRGCRYNTGTNNRIPDKAHAIF